MIDKPNYGDVGRHRVEPAGVPAMKEEIDTGLLVLRKEGKKPPLFCIHGGGGDALDYEDLATSLPQDQPVYAFSLPALENRAHFQQSMIWHHAIFLRSATSRIPDLISYAAIRSVDLLPMRSRAV